MVTFYAGLSSLYDGEHFLDEKIVCIHSSLDAVQLYMERIRKYPILNLDDPDYGMLVELRKRIASTKRRQVVGSYTEYTFPDADRAWMWLDGLNRSWYYMVAHEGGIDSKISGFHLHEDEELYVPAIVEYLINQEDDHFRTELDSCSYALKKLLLYTNGAKGYERYLPRMVDLIELIDKRLTKVGPNELLSPEISMRHPILFCGEDEYRVDVDRAITRAELDREYERHVEEDD